MLTSNHHNVILSTLSDFNFCAYAYYLLLHIYNVLIEEYMYI